MALATQCPHCQTTFRVANDQLKLHGGLVRCGSCQQTFNGIEHLLGPDSLPQSPATLPKPASVDISTAAATASPVVAPPAVVAPAPNSVPTDAPPRVAIPSTSSTTPVPQSETASKIPPVPVPASIPEPVKATLTEPAVASNVSIDSLDFDLGTDETVIPPEQARLTVSPSELTSAALDDVAIGQVELQTRVALMDEPSWSATEAEDEHASTSQDESNVSDIREKREPRFSEPAGSISPDDPVQEKADPEEDYAGDPDQYLHDGLTFDTTGKADSITDDISGEESTPEDDDEFDKPGFILAAEKHKRRSKVLRVLMSLFAVLFFFAAVGQGIYIARNQVAAWLPQTKPMLADACKLVHCQISLLTQIDQISLESNELQALSTDKNVFSLAVQLQNKSSTVQAWPMLELILNDAKDQPVLRKVFSPEEYLSKTADKDGDKNTLANQVIKGFAPASDQQIKLYFELSQSKASGYHVSVFYP